MLLRNLFRYCSLNFNGDVNRLKDLQFSNVSRDSTSVREGDVYFCLTNDKDKASERCSQAIMNGASVVVSNFDLPITNSIMVKDVRDVFATACANFYGRACDKMKIIGITGTNGKTSTSHIIAQMLRANGKKAGVIGTSGVFYNGKSFECPLTTPDADFLHKTFADMYADGVEYVIMEVSAHAIDQKRINGIRFEIGVLTNITQDHLDYFQTMEEYERVKLSFFSPEHIKKGVVCFDDERAIKLIDTATVPIVSYGLKNPSDVFAVDVECTLNGSKFVANVCDEILFTKTNLIGEYNVYNSLASLAVCHELGLKSKQLTQGLFFVEPIEGRFNVLNVAGKYVVVDFAHSPDGMLQVLRATRQLTDGRIHVVFGCGGNRDKTKRSQMGQIAETYADVVCLTDDNPRHEKSQDIIADIESGMTKKHYVVPNRTMAIAKMIDIAKEGDVVLIAGKGAEKYQQIGDTKYPYNDFDAVLEYYKTKNINQTTQSLKEKDLV